jgi:hypothetical protein
MANLSVERQDRLIRRKWSFRTIMLSNVLGWWEGEVTGFSATYRVRVLYVMDPFRDGYELNYPLFPEVTVRSPTLERRAESPDEPIPHVFEERTARYPPLCLFDPALNGWAPTQSIADTTLPWTADWLRFYEIWQATGIWTGGGREHLTTDPAPSARNAEPPAELVQRVARVEDAFSSRITLASALNHSSMPAARWQFLDLLAAHRRRHSVSSYAPGLHPVDERLAT